MLFYGVIPSVDPAYNHPRRICRRTRPYSTTLLRFL